MELTRGTLDQHPLSNTLAAIARRAETGQLTLAGADGKRYEFAFDRGMLVAARSPLAADSLTRIALTGRYATPAQAARLKDRLAAMPSRDEVEVLAALVGLPAQRVAMLRREILLRRAARAFALEDGEYVFDHRSCRSVQGCAVDLRAVVYLGMRLHVSDERMYRELRELGGAHVVLEPGASDDLQRYGFSESERPLLAALREGATLPELEARYRDIDPRTMRAAIRALVACGTARVLSIGSPQTPPHLPRTKTNPELAAEAAERAERALKIDQPAAAVLELERACKLAPADVDFRALYGWALFCATDDKRAMASYTKSVLELAVRKSRNPQRARFYLGRVERMLGRDREALGHFHAVLMLQPDHRDASAEVRVLEARMRRAVS